VSGTCRAFSILATGWTFTSFRTLPGIRAISCAYPFPCRPISPRFSRGAGMSRTGGCTPERST
jgi:hypothetical protein